MPNLEKYVDFNPETDIPTLSGKVMFITGGTNGLGKETILALAKHAPTHIYFSGRNDQAAISLIDEVHITNPAVGMTFIKMDMSSLISVKRACVEFTHDRLDLLMCNAGVMYIPPGLSADGYENHFAINHLAHAMLIRELLPVLLKTADLPDSDVRIISLTSTAWMSHPKHGISFPALRTTQEGFMMGSYRYGQSKLANIVYAAELAKRYPKIKSVSVHPGGVKTDLTTTISLSHKILIAIIFFFMGVSMMEIEQGRLSQVWVAAGARKEQLLNGGYYMPIGRLSNDRLDKTARSERLAEELWAYTQDALAKF